MTVKSKKIYLIGGGIIALAALIIFLSVFLPMLSHRAQMRKLLEKVQTAAARVTVGDPLYETGDLLGNKGKEVLVTGERSDELLALLQEMAGSGYRTAGTEKMSAGSMELNLKVKKVDGEIINLWFGEERFYYMTGTVAVLFESKNQDAYTALYEKLLQAVREL